MVKKWLQLYNAAGVRFGKVNLDNMDLIRVGAPYSEDLCAIKIVKDDSILDVYVSTSGLNDLMQYFSEYGIT